jgi:hypothetical protein
VHVLQKDGADTALTVTVPAGTTGAFHDSSNTVAVAAGEQLRYRSNSTHSVSTSLLYRVSAIQTVFTALSGERLYRIVSGRNQTTGTGFVGLMQSMYLESVEDAIECCMPEGTLRNAYADVIVNLGPGPNSYTLRKNGADTAVVINIPNGTTGQFEDLSNTVAVADEDLVAWRSVRSATLLNIQTLAIDFASTRFWGGGVVGTSPVTMVGSAAANDPRKDGFAMHTADFRSGVNNTLEVNSQVESLITDNWGGLCLYCDVNGQNGATTIKGRKNGSDAGSSFTVTVPATTTGRFTAVGDPIPLVPTDLLNIRRQALGTNASAMEYHVQNFHIEPPNGNGGIKPPTPKEACPQPFPAVTDTDPACLEPDPI